MWSALVAGQEWQGEFRNKKKSGELFWEAASIAGVRGQADKITHYVAVKEEITQRKQLEEAHRRQERLAAVGQLAAGIAHDFNNILAAIALYSQIVGQSPEVGEKNRERMEVINQQVTHASKLIGQILDFSRQSVLERRPLSLVPLLKEQVNLLKRTLPENIAIELAVGPGDQMVNADPTRMQQMLTNLAVNARDAMPEGGRLRFSLETLPVGVCRTILAPKIDSSQCVRLIISDTGTGIPPSVLAHIFDPFYTTKAKGEGTGLGLAQVYGIVGQHHGHINVESQLAVGTVFTVYLPAAETLATELEQPSSSIIAHGRGETVLVVEDEATLRKALVTILAQWNYRVLEAENGEEALALLEAAKSRISLILSDVIMPKMGGVALFHAVKEQGLGMPVILITGHPMGSVLDELVAQGLIACLTKPLELDLLAQTIEQALTH
jgi:signal transduction histidine kinase/ActR/RegA family two-component response regulator